MNRIGRRLGERPLLCGGLAICLVVLLVLCQQVQGAVTPNSVVTPQTPNRGLVQFLQGTDSAGTYKTVYTAGANGSVCRGMEANNSEASQTHLITIQVVNGGVKYGGVAFTSAAGAGFVGGTPPQTIMGNTFGAGLWGSLATDGAQDQFKILVSGDTLQATFATAFVTSGAVIDLQLNCDDF